PPNRLRLHHADGAHALAFLHAGVRDGVLHRGDEDVADLGRRAGGRAEHADARDLAGSAVMGHAYSRVWSDHLASSSSSSRSGFANSSDTPSDASSWPAMSATFGAAAPASPVRDRTSTTRQRFVALYGRVSWMRTRSTSRTSPASSWAAKPLRRRM